MSYLLGIDIGTSGTKSVLFDESGNSITSSTIEYPMYQPHALWAEQDPEDWWRAVSGGVRDILATTGIDPHEIKGIGLSGQMHGLCLLDSRGKVLRKSIIWCDQRTTAECEEITNRVGAARLIEITANPALTGFTASKILWVRNNEPEIYEKTAKILLPKDYIRYKLTGEYATEVSDASGMQLMDIRGRCWSDEVLNALEINPDLLAKMHESCEITGYITKEAAAATGLCPGILVCGGAGDQAAGAVGNGIVKTGVVASTIGTSGVVFAHMDDVAIDKAGRVHTFCHAVPNKWHVMGVTQGAGLSLRWFRDNFCKAETELSYALEQDPYVLMTEAAAHTTVGCDGLIYLPYLMGERTPHLDPYARGVFFGLTARHTKYDMLRAVMEGVSYSLLDCMEIIRGMNVNTGEVRASGGGGKSGLWRQMQADMFGCPVTTTNSSEGPALGVALLAGVAAGLYKSVPDACDATISINSTTAAIEENTRIYKKYYPTYKGVYLGLKDQFKALNQ